MPMTSELQPLPDWLRPRIGRASELSRVQQIIKQRSIHTICEEGRCPNRGECYARGTATFLLMGPVCTRSCGFCQVDKGHAPMPLDPEEPEKVAESVALLGLDYCVLTSVTRDDLPDQGADWFRRTMAAIRARSPQTRIEVLTPDFWGGEPDPERARTVQKQRLETVLADWPLKGGEVYALYPRARQPSLRVRSLVDYLAEAFAGGLPGVLPAAALRGGGGRHGLRAAGRRSAPPPY